MGNTIYSAKNRLVRHLVSGTSLPLPQVRRRVTLLPLEQDLPPPPPPDSGKLLALLDDPAAFSQARTGHFLPDGDDNDVPVTDIGDDQLGNGAGLAGDSIAHDEDFARSLEFDEQEQGAEIVSSPERQERGEG